MNQILLTDDSKVNNYINEGTNEDLNENYNEAINDNYNDNYNDNVENNYNQYDSTKTSKGPMDIQKIIIIFAAIIIIFAVAIIGLSIIKSQKNKNNSGGQNVNSSIDISLEMVDLTETGYEGINDNKVVSVIAEPESDVEKITYTWNGNNETELQKNAEGKYSINIPNGTNELTVVVTDKNGKTKEAKQSFSAVKYAEKPQIDVTVAETDGEKKIRILVSSEIPMKSVEYYWEGEETQTATPGDEDETKVEILLDILDEGKVLKVSALDVNDNSNEYEQLVIPLISPEIKVTKKGEKLHMKISHEKGFKEVDFTINGQEYHYNSELPSYDPNKQLLEYYFNLVDGENTVVIKATSNDEKAIPEVYKGKCEYVPTAE